MPPHVHLFLLIIISSHTIHIDGYRRGAPVSKCGFGDLKPYHSGIAAQTTSLYYTLTASPTTYTADSTVTLTLTGSGTTFRGFLIQAEIGHAQVVGQMVARSGQKTLNCGNNGDDGITHTDGTDKASVTFQWIAPASSVENITFVGSVVRNYGTFWVGETLLVLSPSRPTTTTTSAPETTTTAAEIPTPRSTIQPFTNAPKAQTAFVVSTSTIKPLVRRTQTSTYVTPPKEKVKPSNPVSSNTPIPLKEITQSYKPVQFNTLQIGKESVQPSTARPSNTLTTFTETVQPPIQIPSNTIKTFTETVQPSAPIPSNTLTTFTETVQPPTPIPSNTLTTFTQTDKPSTPIPSNTLTTFTESVQPPTPVPSNTLNTFTESVQPSTPILSNTLTTFTETVQSSATIPSNTLTPFTETVQPPTPTPSKTIITFTETVQPSTPLLSNTLTPFTESVQPSTPVPSNTLNTFTESVQPSTPIPYNTLTTFTESFRSSIHKPSNTITTFTETVQPSTPIPSNNITTPTKETVHPSNLVISNTLKLLTDIVQPYTQVTYNTLIQFTETVSTTHETSIVNSNVLPEYNNNWLSTQSATIMDNSSEITSSLQNIHTTKTIIPDLFEELKHSYTNSTLIDQSFEKTNTSNNASNNIHPNMTLKNVTEMTNIITNTIVQPSTSFGIVTDDVGLLKQNTIYSPTLMRLININTSDAAIPLHKPLSDTLSSIPAHISETKEPIPVSTRNKSIDNKSENVSLELNHDIVLNTLTKVEIMTNTVVNGPTALYNVFISNETFPIRSAKEFNDYDLRNNINQTTHYKMSSTGLSSAGSIDGVTTTSIANVTDASRMVSTMSNISNVTEDVVYSSTKSGFHLNNKNDTDTTKNNHTGERIIGPFVVTTQNVHVDKETHATQNAETYGLISKHKQYEGSLSSIFTRTKNDTSVRSWIKSKPNVGFILPMLKETTTKVTTRTTSKVVTDAPTSVKNVTPMPTTPPQTKNKVLLESGKITYDNQCGTSKGCFVDCTSKDDCSFMVTWKDIGAGVQFELYGKPDPTFPDAWIAVGFSGDTRMQQRGLSGIQGYYLNGVLYCTFVRQKATPIPEIYNLDQDWHLMFASGRSPQLPAWSISKHSTLPVVSSSKLDYQSVTATGRRQTSRAATSSSGQITYDSECGSSKGCFVKCSGNDCEFMVTWQDNNAGGVKFELYGKPSQTEAYVAVGVSGDSNMGDTSVTECVHSGSTIQAFNSVNVGRSNMRLSNPQVGLTNVQGSYSNGVLYCSFVRQKVVPGIPEMKNLDQDWNIMFAKGAASGVFIQQHVDLPPASASKVDYQSFAVVGSGAKFPLVKAHGCLMILAWVLFTGIGVVVARYYKKVWADKKFMKLHIWFQIHRSCMVSALLLDIIAFILIFVEVGGYSQIADIPGKSYLRSHPVLGLIVTALCLANPIMALFRCAPDDAKRTVFNWAHWVVGMTAYILSAICICFGFQLGKSSTPDYAVYIMIVYVLYIIIFDVVFEVIECMSNRENKSKVDGVEMTTRNGTENGMSNGNSHQSKDNLKKKDKMKTVLLVTHIAFTGAFALVLVLVVALN